MSRASSGTAGFPGSLECPGCRRAMSSNRILPPGPGWVASGGRIFWCYDRIAWTEHYRNGEMDQANRFEGRPFRRPREPEEPQPRAREAQPPALEARESHPTPQEPEEPQPRARESPAREARESQAHADVQLLEQRLHFLQVEVDAVSRLLAQARQGPVLQ